MLHCLLKAVPSLEMGTSSYAVIDKIPKGLQINLLKSYAFEQKHRIQVNPHIKVCRLV